MPMTNGVPNAEEAQTGTSVPSSDEFVLDIPSLEPQRKQLRIAGHIVEMRDGREVSLRQASRLVRLLQDANLEQLNNPFLIPEDDFDRIFHALHIVFEIGFVGPKDEPGIPDYVLEGVTESDQFSIGLAFINDFFGVTAVQKVKEQAQAAETVEIKTLEEELDHIVASTGDDKSPGSEHGTEGH